MFCTICQGCRKRKKLFSRCSLEDESIEPVRPIGCLDDDVVALLADFNGYFDDFRQIVLEDADAGMVRPVGIESFDDVVGVLVFELEVAEAQAFIESFVDDVLEFGFDVGGDRQLASGLRGFESGDGAIEGFDVIGVRKRLHWYSFYLVQKRKRTSEWSIGVVNFL